MKKCYSYPKWYLLSGYGLLLSIPLLTLILFLALGRPTPQERIYLFILGSPMILMAVAIIVWLLNMFQTRIWVDDYGITLRSLFRGVEVAWTDIASVQKKYLYLAYWKSSPPRDFEIKTKDGKKLKIFYFIADCNAQDLEEGIKDIESEIKKHTSIEF